MAELDFAGLQTQAGCEGEGCLAGPLRVALIDYHKGNIRSVEKALDAAGCCVTVTDSPDDVASAQAVVLPGVGAFRDASDTLSELGLLDALEAFIRKGFPFLGICLGMHLMFEGGTEHSLEGCPAKGLGVIPGVVSRMPDTDSGGRRFKIPHVGWNSIECAGGITSDSPVIGSAIDGEYFYFTHSYIAPESGCTVALSTHSVTFPCAVRYMNAFGVQFHPEKSSDAGMRLIDSFVGFAQSCNGCAV